MKLKFNGFLVLLLVLVAQLSFAQERAVSGTVSDNAGMPLPGVSVLVKGTKTGTQTDFDGKFSIKVSPSQILVFSYIGMKTQEVAASSSTVNVKLADAGAQELEGVVVTAFGIKREKKSLGYATTTLKADALTQVVNTNPFETLSGKIAGVDITAPSQPGASTKVVIRGLNTITGNNGPLYVVDGTPINNSATGTTTTTRSYDAGNGISDIDPNNIESMTVLKGAAASALYGSRAGGGVIIITTKKGKANSGIKVDLLASTEFSEVARVPHLQNQFGQGWSGEGYSGANTYSNENGSWGPAFNGEVRPWGTIYENTQQLKPYVALKDNVRDFYNTGVLSTQSATLSGGGDTSDFSLVFSNVNSDGVVPTDADLYQKQSLGFNGGLKGKKFTLRTSINYVYKNQSAINTGQGDDAGQGSTLQQDLLQIPRDISIVDLKDYKNNPFNTPDYYFTPYAANPYFSINENSTKIFGNNLFGNINLSYKLTDKITATWQIGGNYRTERLKSYGAIVDYLPGTPQAVAGANPVVGGVTEGRSEFSEFDTFFNINYNTNLGEDWTLNLLGGLNYNKRESDQLFNTVTNLGIPGFYELSNSALRPVITQSNSLRRTGAVYASAEFAFKNRYFATITGREDKTSTLPTSNNAYFYPSLSLGAIVIDNGSTFLKLRGAASKIANDTSPYVTEDSYISGSAAANFGILASPLGGVSFFEASGRLGNPDLKPESTVEYEVGAEGSFFKNRISYDIALYHKTTSDVIVNLPLDPSTGYTIKAINAGDVVNKGIELSVTGSPIKNKDFSWNLTYTFTKNLNEVTELTGGNSYVDLTSAYGVTFRATKGEPIGTFYSQVPKTNAAGQYIVNASTGMYEVSDDIEKIGNSQRDFVMGLQNTFKYKNFNLAFSLDWKQGGEFYSYTKRLSHFVGNGIETTYNDRNPFIVPNSVNENVDAAGNVTYTENTTPLTFETVTNFYNTTNNPGIEKTHVIDKTFVRLREINFNYDFPSSVTKNMGLNKISLGVYARNLFMWTPGANPYTDPETGTYGTGVISDFGEFASNPSQRSVGGVLKLSF
ncbi:MULTISPECIES: SusC/RagA family TonB-linked outer membrane protein [unclassified Flavobacterium]|uniref:SusC/RagA family TonB-linked outer membrane protein n=1 Tax=unclassified Flavobacterium TaxID=196869 RepID=UPI001066D7AE|nr:MULTISPECIES: SusC/RagA family TonB-linked outer membrane protein [unclassified Flavobacterium]TDX08625.1 TonB-linked SusC/RagA family outer membrane protein [Flavobacterium sp. S87F.05.LMB.W.Kidney.N]BDU23638.1 SusC/RagA family TonB-linked outer membrane protein [Flavobacterium sp. GSB-24]